MTSRTRFARRRLAIAAILMALVSVGLAVKVGAEATAGVGLPLPAIIPGWSGAAGGDGEIGIDERVTLDDVAHPALAHLDPALLEAVRRAAADGAGEGIEFWVTSGWRSPEYQARLLSEAVSDYGSLEEARRWVASPDTSLHVSGDAIDIGGFDATYWLGLNGAAYGLCQIYANERWHFELRPEAVTQGCPEQYLDPTHDPRMRG